MANNVVGHVIGSDKKVLDEVSTVADVKSKLKIGADYTASLNGQQASDSEEVSAGDYVTFSRAVKGGI